ncbi:N-acetylmuramoyl-L-alanine amidase [uncultured Paludibaculum sp.]|uniref:N-acetylmuramoyl-L-alanine amidase n=1 Tax=uncultured Paludibaculum sp. TaxID=1765020 RepID=UPI002AAADF0F|nr:N-acetylmuramoyl-L-alanine amidase [uncultured Paludibaculum sp.]
MSAAAARAESGETKPLASVTSVRFWSLGQATRVALEVSEEVRYRFEKLQNPDRLFVDLSETRMKLNDKAFYTVKVGDKLVKQIRVAQKDPRVMRIVLDLEGPVEQEISQLSNPSRIIIEVRPAGSKAAGTPISQSRTGVEKIDVPVKEEPKPEPVRTAAVRPPAVERPASVKTAAPAATSPATARTVEPEPTPIEPVIPPSSNAPDATPKAARPNSGGGRSLTRALGLKIDRVVIDPGHGGHDHGTTGPTGLTEKDLVLDVSLRLGALLEQRMGSQVLLTRSTDTYVGLEERAVLANQNKADLFLSIHANATPYKNISGAEVYYLNFTTSKEATEVAARENAGSGKSVFELRELIQKIALKDRLDESREFATRVQASLASTWSKMDPAAKNRGVKKAPFVVLIGASMPSVLAEIGFISNPHDEALLRKPDQRQRLAEALFRGIQQYANSLSQDTQAEVSAAAAAHAQSGR